LSPLVPCAYGSPGRWQPRPTELAPPLVPAWASSPAEDLVDTPILGEDLAFCVSRPRGLVALDASSGREAWRRDTLRGWGSCQLTADGSLVTTPRPGVLAVLDSTSGADIRSFEVRDILLQYGVIADALVVSPLEEGTIGAWDLSAGRLAWRVPASWRPSLLSASAGAVCFTEQSAYVALDLATGGERWRFDVTELGRHHTAMWGDRPGQTTGHPIVADDTAYVGVTGGWLIALDLRSGAVRWQSQVNATIPSNFALAPGNVLLFLGDDTLVTIDARTGNQRDRRMLAGSPDTGSSGPYSPVSVTTRYLWTVDRRGRLVAISRDEARVSVIADLGSRVPGPPALGGGRLFVVDSGGRLAVFGEESANRRVPFSQARL